MNRTASRPSVRLTRAAALSALVAVAAGAGVAVGAPAGGQTATAAGETIGFGQLDRTDRQLMSRLANIKRTFTAAAPQVWSARFRPDRMPFAYVRVQGARGRSAYVLNNPGVARLPGAQRVELPARFDLGTVYRVTDAPFVRRVSQRTPYEFDWSVAGTGSMMMAYTSRNPRSAEGESSPATRDYELFAVHEAFHRFQDVERRWQEAVRAIQLPEGRYPRNKRSAALAQLEDRILAQGTGAVSRERALQIVRRFVAVREAREAVSAVVSRHDENQEKFEGMARYVEGTYAQHAPGPAVVGGWNRAELTEAWELADEEPGYVREHLAFGRFYSSGAAVGNLLDRATGGAAWRTQMARTRQTPADVAAGVAGGFDRAAALAAAKRQHDFAAIEQQIAGLTY